MLSSRFSRSMLNQAKVFTQKTAMAGEQRMGKATVALLPSNRQSKINPYLVANGLALLALAQFQLGSADNFFEHKFTVDADPQDLADFYGTEDFMEIFCVFPFMVNIMMRGAEFDDEGNIHAWGISGPGNLLVTIQFDEEEDDDSNITYFNKKETFSDIMPAWLGGLKIWEMTQNFGFRMREDGKAEITHNGEKFRGFFPMRLVFQIHSHYVIWATEKYVKSKEFSVDDGERKEEVRQNVPLHEFQNFISGLTGQIEAAKADPANSSEEKQRELEVTLQRLNTIKNMQNAQVNIKPRLLTLRSHKTNKASVHLMVDDAETKETIQLAMNQISETAGKKAPLNNMRNLSRRTTLANKGQ